jgi:Ca2+-binding RTX toxin-like protein
MALITGTINADTLIGTASADTILGSAGDDLIKSREGNDSVLGGDGNDTVYGGYGNDQIHGGNGDDILFGTSANDLILGEAGNDVIRGGSGNDTLSGGNGSDIIFGGAGNDTIYGDAGNDVITGGSGYDTIDYSSFGSGINADMSTHAVNSILGSALIDGIEKFVGSRFSDTISGDHLANEIWGGTGNDVIRGHEGADKLIGGAGQDTFVFLKKDVVLAGVHQGVDTIGDFAAGDKIDVRDFFKGHAIADYGSVMKLTEDGAHTTLSIKMGAAFVDVASISGHITTPVQTLVHDQVILA